MSQVSMSLSRDLAERYFFCDPAAGKKAKELKNVQCDSAIVGCAQDWLGRIFVIYVWSTRVRTDELVEKILEVNRIWRPVSFGIESNAMQSLFVDSMMMHAQAAGESVPIVGIEQPRKITKEWRIRMALQGPLSEGRLFFLGGEDGKISVKQQQLMKRLNAFPRGRKIDDVDALASCVTMIPKPVVRRQKSAEEEQLSSYLRRRGASPGYIKRRIAQVRAEAGGYSSEELLEL